MALAHVKSCQNAHMLKPNLPSLRGASSKFHSSNTESTFTAQPNKPSTLHFDFQQLQSKRAEPLTTQVWRNNPVKLSTSTFSPVPSPTQATLDPVSGILDMFKEEPSQVSYFLPNLTSEQQVFRDQQAFMPQGRPRLAPFTNLEPNDESVNKNSELEYGTESEIAFPNWGGNLGPEISPDALFPYNPFPSDTSENTSIGQARSLAPLVMYTDENLRQDHQPFISWSSGSTENCIPTHSSPANMYNTGYGSMPLQLAPDRSASQNSYLSHSLTPQPSNDRLRDINPWTTTYEDHLY